MDEDDIREADSIIVQQLLDDTRSDFDKQIEEALYISLQEVQTQQSNFEEQVKNDYLSESTKRTEYFKDFLFNLKKISKFDNEVREIYEIIEPIIETYCNQFITICELDGQTYDKIFNTLKKIRHSNHVLLTLETIISRETH